MAFVHPYKVEDGGIRRDEAVQVWGNDKEKGARAKEKQGRGKGRRGKKMRRQPREEGRRVTLEWAVSQSVQTNTSVFKANS